MVLDHIAARKIVPRRVAVLVDLDDVRRLGNSFAIGLPLHSLAELFLANLVIGMLTMSR